MKTLSKIGMLICMIGSLLISACKQELSGQNIEIQQSSLIGSWEGNGHLFDAQLNKTLGAIPVKISIEKTLVSGVIGDAHFVSSKLKQSGTHIIVTAELDKDFDNRYPTNKRKLELLLPISDANLIKELDMDFHIKQNFILDFSMLVGNAKLKALHAH
jgi:hypothetical protein